MQWACLIKARTSLTSSDHYKTPLGYEEIGQHPGDQDPVETRASPTTAENMTWQLCLKGQKERVACYHLKRITDLKAEDKEMVRLDLFGYLVQTLLLFTSWISPSNHFLRDGLTHKHSKRCFMSYIQHDRQCYILSVSFMQTMRSGLKLTNQQFSILSSDHRNWVKMSRCLVQFWYGHDVKRPYGYFTYYGERKNNTQQHFSFSELGYCSLEFNSRKICQHLKNWTCKNLKWLSLKKREFKF